MKEIQVRIKGLAPLLMHATTTLDPLHPLTKAIKQITSKTAAKTTEADHEKKYWLEWQAGLYWDDALGGPYVPAPNIEKMLRDGAAENRKGKQVQAGMVLTDDRVPLIYSPRKTSTAKLYEDKQFVYMRSVVVQRSRVIRTRPIFPAWELEFSLLHAPEVVSAEEIQRALEISGARKGLGEYRPKFGRFSIEKFAA